ncbi:uncharacterized protein LOC142978203 [Anticarsia gemmatalis]|uniref:uncharacterized protein LOC142978203 n=1 Tax=Anticarsia gemmatalis TaxID=129554 RepID=UPI003F75BAC0
MFKLVVLSVVLAVAAAKPGALGLAGLAPWGGLGLGGHLGLGAHLGAVAAPLAAPVVAAPLAHAGPAVAVAAPLHGAAYNYRGPLSLAPGQPANIVAHDGRPLDTLSVNVDRALHYTARAVDGAHGHLLGKRSAPLLAPAAWSHAARIDVPAVGLGHAALAVPAVAAWRAPLAAPLGVGHWGGLGHAGRLGHLW